MNLVDLLYRNAEIRPQKAALYTKSGGDYVPTTYHDLLEQVEAFALGLRSQFTLKRSDCVALLSENGIGWVISDMAILSLGLVTVPIFDTLSAEEIKPLLQDCSARFVIVSNQNQLEKIKQIQRDCKDLEAMIVLNPMDEQTENYTLHQLQQIGRSASQKDRESFLAIRPTVTSEDLASIVYTSGSTGLAKGVQLTHGNFLSNVEDIVSFVAIDERDSVLSFLPLSHVLERTVGYYTLIYIGGSIYYAQSIQSVGEDIKTAKPTVLISVPRLFEKIESRILNSLHGLSRVIFNLALKAGYAWHRSQKKGKPFFWLRWQNALAHKVVFTKIQQKMGGHLRFCVSGGAPLPQAVGEFFEALGVCIIEGYGLTETSPVICCNHPDHNKIGTVGTPLQHVKVMLADDGELLVQGPNVTKGYYKNPEETKLAFTPDGWFCTGDIAQIDEEGTIKIVGRKKDLIVMSTGKKVAPQPLEMMLSRSKYVSQVVIVGEGRNYLTALIVPDTSEIDLYLKGRSIACAPDQLLRHTETTRLFKELLQNELGDLAPYRQVKRFTLLSQELTQENGELTPTLKIKRHVIHQRYANEINAMYG